ncbi:hypothetical protein BURCENBC7_AP1315 [Burkholderia cenocepacia BC7]|nr:hypothetical protein BURCENK562V_C7372 [Burkholderia cenocepacia K56-2Valvano]ERI27080.1 hypothetical protein BURCENBC7_AP1315 [Burkholderia cenocepacia BC7]
MRRKGTSFSAVDSSDVKARDSSCGSVPLLSSSPSFPEAAT